MRKVEDSVSDSESDSEGSPSVSMSLNEPLKRSSVSTTSISCHSMKAQDDFVPKLEAKDCEKALILSDKR